MYKIYKLISCLILILLSSLHSRAQESPTKNDYVTTDDNLKLYTKKSGKGPIAIFVHGGPGAWSKSFEDLGGKNLESHLTMIYYDQRGSGRSGKSLSGDYSMGRMIEDIDLIRKHYNRQQVILLSHSFGGILAVNYTLRYPDHVKGLILVNSTLNLRHSLKNQTNYINNLVGTNFVTSDSTNEEVISTFLKARNALSAKGISYKMLSDKKKSVDLVHEIDDKNPSGYEFAQNTFQEDDYLKDYTKITPQIKVPVLIITGEKDHSVGEDHYLSFHFKNQKIKKIDGGHLLYYENNKEFRNSVFRFIKEPGKS